MRRGSDPSFSISGHPGICGQLSIRRAQQGSADCFYQSADYGGLRDVMGVVPPGRPSRRSPCLEQAWELFSHPEAGSER